MGLIIDFTSSGNSRHFIRAGWSKCEGGFTWTAHRNASLAIPLSDWNGGYRCVMNLLPHIRPPALPIQEMIISVGDVEICRTIFDSNKEWTSTSFDLPAGVTAGAGVLQLDFTFPFAIAPVELGDSTDPRALGVAAHSLRLDECESLGDDDAAVERMYRRALETDVPRAGGLARQQRQDEAVSAARDAVALVPGDSAIVALFRGPSAATAPEPALFARDQDVGRTVLFAPLMPPPQLPLVDEASMSAEIRDQHYEYPMPPDVAVYYLSGFRLCGTGLFQRGDEIFYRDDVLPPYFRSFLLPGGQRLPGVWGGRCMSRTCRSNGWTCPASVPSIRIWFMGISFWKCCRSSICGMC